MEEMTDWIVLLPSGTYSEPCESIEEAREVVSLNPGAGPVYRRGWTVEEI